MNTRRIIGWILACALLLAACAAGAEEAREAGARNLVERITVTYASKGVRDEEALAALSALDPGLGEKWTRVMDLWAAPVTVNDALPDGLLPDDDSLCLVALGFQLNPDGTMRDELVERLKVLLTAAKQYPRALIVCTGGGTAANAPAATEAGRMAEWLLQRLSYRHGDPAVRRGSDPAGQPHRSRRQCRVACAKRLAFRHVPGWRADRTDREYKNSLCDLL